MRVRTVTSVRLEPAGTDASRRAGTSRVEGGDALAASFDTYVHQNQGGLVRYATLLSGSVAHGEDLVQDVLTRLFPRWDTITRRDGNHHAYVRRSITNEYLSWRRRWSTRNIHLADDDVLDSIAEDPWSEMHDDGVWLVLQELPRQQRAALVLRYYEGLTDAEIGDVLACKQVTVRAYISRGLTTLRDHANIAPTRRDKRS
jgi:RNA polymerase sigma factor (sigma-70 family)